MSTTLLMLIMGLHILGTAGLVLSFLILLKVSAKTGILCATGFLAIGTPCFNKLTYPTFTHMKGAINGWNPHMDWRDSVRWTLTNNFDFIVGGYAQHYPFHYFQKTFCTEELVDRYEQRLGI